MSEGADQVPVVSIAAIAANVAEEDITLEDWCRVGETLVKVFSDTGFCCVKDHGVDQSFFDKCLQLSKDFFCLPLETKKQRLRGEFTEDFYGWLPMPYTEGINRKPESFDNSKPPDHKETYNLSDAIDQSRFATDDEVPGFRAMTLQLIQKMELVSRRMLIALGYGLNLAEPQALWKISSKVGTKMNNTTLRYAFYPRVSPEAMKDDLGRCGEHTDFGTLTLLLNNGVSGLQIKTRKGKYLMVPTHKDALIVNIADSLERITGGVLRSAPHRVIITEESSKEERHSAIYFRVPDDDAYLDPLCGDKEKYEEKISAIDFFHQRFQDIFIHGAGVAKNTM